MDGEVWNEAINAYWEAEHQMDDCKWLAQALRNVIKRQEQKSDGV